VSADDADDADDANDAVSGWLPGVVDLPADPDIEIIVTTIAAGASHSVAVTSTGRCYAWGWGVLHIFHADIRAPRAAGPRRAHPPICRRTGLWQRRSGPPRDSAARGMSTHSSVLTAGLPLHRGCGGCRRVVHVAGAGRPSKRRGGNSHSSCPTPIACSAVRSTAMVEQSCRQVMLFVATETTMHFRVERSMSSLRRHDMFGVNQKNWSRLRSRFCTVSMPSMMPCPCCCCSRRALWMAESNLASIIVAKYESNRARDAL
jgi:hypothetical protein